MPLYDWDNKPLFLEAALADYFLSFVQCVGQEYLVREDGILNADGLQLLTSLTALYEFILESIPQTVCLENNIARMYLEDLLVLKSLTMRYYQELMNSEQDVITSVKAFHALSFSRRLEDHIHRYWMYLYPEEAAPPATFPVPNEEENK